MRIVGFGCLGSKVSNSGNTMTRCRSSLEESRLRRWDGVLCVRQGKGEMLFLQNQIHASQRRKCCCAERYTEVFQKGLSANKAHWCTAAVELRFYQDVLQVDCSTLQHLIGSSCSMDLQQQCVRGQTTSEIQGLGEWLSTC